ncbi:MAG: Ricin B lectin, partial [Terracidiphilus sp.]
LKSSTTPESIEQLAPEVRDMEALEAPNECDVSGNCGGSQLAGIRNVLAFLPTIDSAAAHMSIPVIGPSFTQQSSFLSAGNISGKIARNNLHIYFGGRNPGSTGWGDLDSKGNGYGSFAWWLDQANIDAPGVPIEVTETGYMAYPETNTPFTLPESVEASYTPRTLLLAFKNGIKRTFLYELLDEVSSPGYGILRSDLSPKPAFTAVENLITNLSDKGNSFSPGTLGYTITGGGPSLDHLLLEKRDGSFWLVLWLEEPSFNPTNDKPIEVTPQNITLKLEVPDARQILRWDETGNMNWTNATMQGDDLDLRVSDQITIVKIVP